MDHKTKARPFQYDTFSSVFNPNRHSHVTALDALVDPNITIRHEDNMPYKRPEYLNLGKRDTYKQDKVSRVIHDYTGRPMIKVDQEGGIFDNTIPVKQPLSPRLQKSGIEIIKKDEDGKYQAPGLYGGLSVKPTKTFTGIPCMKPMDPSSEVDELTKKGLMQRKLYLMKLMLKNEKKANAVIKQKISALGSEMHQNATAVKMYDKLVNK